MSRTLNQLIAAAIDGGEEVEETSTPTVDVEQHEAVKTASTNLDDIEKLASALEFLGHRGVGTLLGKTASEASAPPPGTNMGQMHREHVQSQVAHNASSSPMKGSKSGLVENNMGKTPGSGSSVDTTGKGLGTHHSALSSNEAAINYDKKEKAKKVAPALSAVLDNAAFADPKLKENISSASAKGDRNIKKAHDAQAVRAELARRAAGGA